MGSKRISMVLIARDEAENIEPCFATFWPHVDEIILVDTGSEDGTVEAARRFAAERGEPDKLVLGEFEWRDDVAAARNYADSLASGDWLSWTDLDDRVRGAEHLRPLAVRAPASAAGYCAAYRLRPGRHSRKVMRPRLIRSGWSVWEGRIHEGLCHRGSILSLPPHVIEWVHSCEPQRPGSRNRNLRVAQRWALDEPDNPRALYYELTETAVQDAAEASRLLERYLYRWRLPPQELGRAWELVAVLRRLPPQELGRAMELDDAFRWSDDARRVGMVLWQIRPSRLEAVERTYVERTATSEARS